MKNSKNNTPSNYSIGARSFNLPPAKQHVKTDNTATYIITRPNTELTPYTMSATPEEAREFREKYGPSGFRCVKYNQRIHPVPANMQARANSGLVN